MDDDVFQVSGVLHNTGQSLVFRPDTGLKHSLAVNVSDGPLAYRYQIEEVFLHYGTDNSHGSEHRIQGNAFPAEVIATPFYYAFSAFVMLELFQNPLKLFNAVVWVFKKLMILIRLRIS